MTRHSTWGHEHVCNAQAQLSFGSIAETNRPCLDTGCTDGGQRMTCSYRAYMPPSAVRVLTAVTRRNPDLTGRS